MNEPLTWILGIVIIVIGLALQDAEIRDLLKRLARFLYEGFLSFIEMVKERTRR